MSVSTTPRRLSAVADPPAPDAGQIAAAAALAGITEVTSLAAAAFAGRRPRLSDWQRMQVEQARKLLMDAPELFATRPDAYVAGLIEGAASTLLDVIDAVTEV